MKLSKKLTGRPLTALAHKREKMNPNQQGFLFKKVCPLSEVKKQF